MGLPWGYCWEATGRLLAGCHECCAVSRKRFFMGAQSKHKVRQTKHILQNMLPLKPKWDAQNRSDETCVSQCVVQIAVLCPRENKACGELRGLIARCGA